VIAVDTNIVVRFLTQDDKRQYKKCLQLFKDENIFIPDTVILETVWVLSFVYKFKPGDISMALGGLFGLPNIVLSNAQAIATVLGLYEQGVDFADAFHLAMSEGCSELKTFDKAFARKAKGLSGCTVITL